MKRVKSFSLDSVVAAAVDDIPKNERSRRINRILREALLEEGKPDDVSMGQIKNLIQSMMKNSPEEKVDNDKAKNALNGIIGMRKG